MSFRLKTKHFSNDPMLSKSVEPLASTGMFARYTLLSIIVTKGSKLVIVWWGFCMIWRIIQIEEGVRGRITPSSICILLSDHTRTEFNKFLNMVQDSKSFYPKNKPKYCYLDRCSNFPLHSPVPPTGTKSDCFWVHIYPCICSVQFYLAIQLIRVQIPFVNSFPFFLSLLIVKQLGCRAIFLTLVFELSMKASAQGWSTKSWRQIWRSSCPFITYILNIIYRFTYFYTRYIIVSLFTHTLGQLNQSIVFIYHDKGRAVDI